MTNEFTEMEQELKHLKSALFAWEGGACNPTALVNSLKRFVDECPEIRFDVFNTHPATKLYLSQLSYLAGIGIGDCGNAVEQANMMIRDLEDKMLSHMIDNA